MASSIRARAREEGLGEVEGGGSGPNFLGGECSGEEGVSFHVKEWGLGRRRNLTLRISQGRGR